MLPHFPYNPSPPLSPLIHSLSYKSHDPSVNCLTTQAERGGKLETPLVSLIRAWRKKQKSSFPLPSLLTPPPPPISFVFVVKAHFQSFPEVASDVWHQHILLGREIKGGNMKRVFLSVWLKIIFRFITIEFDTDKLQVIGIRSIILQYSFIKYLSGKFYAFPL